VTSVAPLKEVFNWHRHNVFMNPTVSSENHLPPYRSVTMCTFPLGSIFAAEVNLLGMHENDLDIGGNWASDVELNSGGLFVRAEATAGVLGGSFHTHTLSGIGSTTAPTNQFTTRTKTGFTALHSKTHFHTFGSCPSSDAVVFGDTERLYPQYVNVHFRETMNSNARLTTGLITWMKVRFQCSFPLISSMKCAPSPVTCAGPPMGWADYSGITWRYPRGSNASFGMLGGAASHIHSYVCTSGGGIGTSFLKVGPNSGANVPSHYHRVTGNFPFFQSTSPRTVFLRFILKKGSSSVDLLFGSVHWSCNGVADDDISVCSGHGTCSDLDVCTCDSGWSSDCDVADCPTRDQCSGSNGVCTGPNACTCVSGWKGLNCTVFDCPAVNQCSGNGICTGPNICTCNALSGWIGSSCDVVDCPTRDQCSGSNGVCTGPNACTCVSGWQGLNCTVFDCPAVNQCSGNGICTGPNICTCNALSGWIGPGCDMVDCSMRDQCSGSNGVCTGPNACTCEEGWKGLNCSVFHCQQVYQCSDNGICTGPNVCTCDSNSGWIGPRCDDVDCPTRNECSGANGVCTGPNVCSCVSGWKGLNCTVFDCPLLNQCSGGNGSCTGPNACTCHSGFRGDSCGEFDCPLSDQCSLGNGFCSAPNVCNCSSAWAGRSCDRAVISATARTLDLGEVVSVVFGGTGVLLFVIALVVVGIFVYYLVTRRRWKKTKENFVANAAKIEKELEDTPQRTPEYEMSVMEQKVSEEKFTDALVIKKFECRVNNSSDDAVVVSFVELEDGGRALLFPHSVPGIGSAVEVRDVSDFEREEDNPMAYYMDTSGGRVIKFEFAKKADSDDFMVEMVGALELEELSDSESNIT